MNPLLSMQQNRPAPSVSSENGAELTSGDRAGAVAIGLCGLFVTRVAARACPHCEILGSLFGTSATFPLVRRGAPGRIRTCDARFRKSLNMIDLSLYRRLCPHR